MRIAISGTRGIPNSYGGFEQFAQKLSLGLSELGHEVAVYSPHHHFYREKKFNGVKIIHQYDPQFLGTAGQFIYDLNCILDSRKKGFDIILQLGYTSSSIWSKLLPNNIVLTNMDGFEWKRSKYNGFTQKFLKRAEKWAVNSSHYLIADHPEIKDYYDTTYRKPVKYIPYGAEIFSHADSKKLHPLQIEPYGYDLVIARMEPENQVDMILQGVSMSSSRRKCMVVGDISNNYGKRMKKKYMGESRIRFLGKIFNQDLLNQLRYFSFLYFHGHSVGGTNPSLLEAMAARSLICAHDNIFNKYVLGKNGYYFSDYQQISYFRDTLIKENNEDLLESNRIRIEQEYSWNNVIRQYETLFKSCLS